MVKNKKICMAGKLGVHRGLFFILVSTATGKKHSPRNMKLLIL